MTAPDGKTPRSDALVEQLRTKTERDEVWNAEDMSAMWQLSRQLERELAQTAAQLAECNAQRDEAVRRHDALRLPCAASILREQDTDALLTAAIAERDAAIRDAERYRWLRAHCRVTVEASSAAPEHAGLVYYYGVANHDDRSSYTPEGLDAAIDAARQETGG